MTYLYIYYRSGTEAKRYTGGGGTMAILSTAADWFQLDHSGGIEEFIVVMAKSQVGALDQLTEDSPDPAGWRMRCGAWKGDAQVTRDMLPHQ